MKSKTGNKIRIAGMMLIYHISYITSSFAQNNDSAQVTIENIGNAINSPYSEFAPLISADGSTMIFTSTRPLEKKDSTNENRNKEHVFISYYNDSLHTWSKAQPLGHNINSSQNNSSVIAFSNDGQTMLLYKASPDGNIYSSALKGEEWSVPKILPSPINSSVQETSACFSPDGRTIYFTSNRKHGQGGLDIWKSEYNTYNDTWKEAKNLGPKVNTSEDEEAVFMPPDGKTLYFSSKGHNTKGGFDIYKTVFKNNKWSTPVNLGSPINTTDDDLFFVLTADSSTAYYSSGGLRSKDIYKILFSYPRKENHKQVHLTLFKGVTIDKETGLPFEAQIEISDNDSSKVITTVKSNSVTGEFLVSLPAGKNYGITIKKEGYLFCSENFNIPDTATYKAMNFNIPLQKLSSNTNSTSNTLSNITDNNLIDNTKNTATANNSTNSNYPRKENQKQVHLTLFKGVTIDKETGLPFVAQIEISDNDSSKVITTIKSNSVTGEFLVSLPAGKNYGITITKEGYLFCSENFNIPDTATYKVMNFNIPLQKLSSNTNSTSNTLSNITDNDSINNTKNTATANNSTNSNTINTTESHSTSTNSTNTAVSNTTETNVINNKSITDMAIGEKIILKNIYYDYDKATLLPESIAELKRLVKLMDETPTMKIEVSSYTDSKGTEQYNLILSQARTQAVVDFLFAAGISLEQMVAKGYGESLPLFSNDTEKGRQLNRRTEFKIIHK